jgi:N-acetylmuramoyl-L-alanine amidase
MIGIAIGHSRYGDQGAWDINSVSEREFNNALIPLITAMLKVPYVVYNDYKASSYVGAMNYVARKMKRDGITACVELHFNSASPKATGHEWLHWETSRGGKTLATQFKNAMDKAYPELASRGLKPKKKGSRGSLFLRKTPCPAVIAEPFFGSNKNDVALIHADISKLAGVYAAGINSYYG